MGTEPGGPCVTAEGNQASPTPATPAWMTLTATFPLRIENQSSGVSQAQCPAGFKMTCPAHCMAKARIPKPVPKRGHDD